MAIVPKQKKSALRGPAKVEAREDEYRLRMILHAYETGVGHGQQGRGATFKDENWGDPDLVFAYRQGVQQGEKGGSAQPMFAHPTPPTAQPGGDRE